MKRLLLHLSLILFPLWMLAGHITINDTIRGSDIYPGTVHTLQVTIPDQYDGATPANLYVGLDGILCNAPEVIDDLIGEGVIDPTVGVFLQPGVIYGEDGKVVSYNRSNEFDATDDRFARFLETEVLSRVESLKTPDGRAIKFSSEPARRMIFGLSSGGIGAFTAAWHRPDLFGKVYTGCGTFVPMRGGEGLQALVRKSEPRPLRIFLQDGFQDSWNPLFGSWFEANAMLASALEFAGYDHRVDWTNGGHSVSRTSQIFPDVMRWMFRHGTTPIAMPESKNNMLADILVSGANWKSEESTTTPRKTKAKNAAYACATYPDGRHRAVARPATNYLWKEILDNEGKVIIEQPFYWLHTYNNSVLEVPSMTFDSKGNLWVLSNAGIQICDQNGRVRAILPLPRDFILTPESSISIGEGTVSISSPVPGNSRIFSRRLNITPAVPGQTPESQGAA